MQKIIKPLQVLMVFINVQEITKLVYNDIIPPHSYHASWYYQSFIYSPTDALVSCLKKNIKIYIKIYTKTAVLI